ncbi:MAG TPA: hypothetical protein VF483_10405 [Gemmatimonadaceae bacterium]
MSIPPRLATKLNETLGAPAAGDLVNWLDQMRAEHQEMRADFAELRQELRATELRLSGVLGDNIANLGKELRQEMHVVDNKIEKRFSDLLLWSFVFWVGAVGAIAMLAGVLRH